MEEFQGSPTALVSDVDCTAAGKELCEVLQVTSFPTIKYGDPGNLQDYKGGRTLAELRQFATEALGPGCGPEAPELCSEETKQKIEGFMKMTPHRLEGKARSLQKVLAEEVPLMKMVLAYRRKSKSEL
mmetsp:Transcript_105329/g.307912  ORF Transcript_105329/g.307912 Transcript_105329/m.307912 type:complete len:128 (-) Transcript_105329:48-431(-)